MSILVLKLLLLLELQTVLLLLYVVLKDVVYKPKLCYLKLLPNSSDQFFLLTKLIDLLENFNMMLKLFTKTWLKLLITLMSSLINMNKKTWVIYFVNLIEVTSLSDLDSTNGVSLLVYLLTNMVL